MYITLGMKELYGTCKQSPMLSKLKIASRDLEFNFVVIRIFLALYANIGPFSYSGCHLMGSRKMGSVS
jgi:hypothetical protein